MFNFIFLLLLATTSLISQPLENQDGWRPAWGLDRIDQRGAALNDRYDYSLTGAGVTVYVFDSGIYSGHEDFGGRVEPGFGVITDGLGAEDCAGHGTHSASLIGGTKYGVAKQVKLVSVRVLNCNNGNSSMASLYPAFDWIIEHHKEGVPAIVNMSVGTSKSVAFNEATQRLIDDGLIVVAASGNQNRDACLYSPASQTSVIAVGAIDMSESRAHYSNYGPCVDILAPGSDIVGAWVGTSNTYRSSSGTSNAAPIVSGIVALMLEQSPQMTQVQVEEKLKNIATVDAIKNVGVGSSNLLAYSLFDVAQNPIPTTTTTVPVTTPTVPVTTTTIPYVSPTTTTVQPVQTTVPDTVNGAVCSTPATRTVFYGVPYVCVNTGNQLMWISKRYSPGRP